MNETNGGHVNGREIAVGTLMTIAALAVAVGAVYLWGYMHGNDLSNGSILSSAEQRLAGSKPTPAQLAASLEAAQAKLARESAALSAMKADFPSSPALDKQIDGAYAAAIAAVKKTDKLFNDPDSQDPTLKNAAADPAAAAAIASLRAEINAALAAWQAAYAASENGGSTLALSQKALADLGVMQTYVNQLQNYFAALPPSNALQSDVIIADQSQLQDIASSVNDAINEVDSVGGPPIIAANDSSQNPADNGAGGSPGADNDSNAPQNTETPGSGGAGASSPSGNGSNGSSGSGGSSSGDQSNGGGSSGGSNGNAAPPVVTVGDVVGAQNNVDQTSGEIQSIEQQINDSGNSNPGSGGSGSGGSLDYWGSQGSNGGQGLNDNGSNGSGDNSDYMQYIPPEDLPSTGPHLIQGDNPFQ